jgi:hypothetical protein
MRKLLFALVVGASLWSVAHADQTSCSPPSETILLRPPLGYEVAGSGRLYFHTTPDEKCVRKNVFVVPKDKLVAYEEYGGWSSVVYLAKGGHIYTGWVSTNRLKFVGTEGSTDPRDVSFYEKAKDAAKAGKLGSPWEGQ